MKRIGVELTVDQVSGREFGVKEVGERVKGQLFSTELTIDDAQFNITDAQVLSVSDQHDESTPADWPEDFDDDDAARSALDDEELGSQLSAVDDPEGGEDGGIEVSGITSHQLRCGAVVEDMSTFRPRFTDQYWARVALYDARGSRVYLGPYRDKGGANAYQTLIHRERVNDSQRLAKRGLVIWKAVNDGRYESSWKNC